MPNNPMYLQDYSKPIKDDLENIEHDIYFKRIIFENHHCFGTVLDA